jgi:protein TonB
LNERQPAQVSPGPIPIVDAVFERGGRRSSRTVVAAMGIAVALHAMFWWWARRREPSLEEWSAALAARIHTELARREAVELLPPPPMAPIPESREPPAPRRVHPAASEKARKPPPPAEPGRIIAREPRTDVPVDLTKDAFVIGGATAYAGGTTTAQGTNKVAVSSSRVDPNAPPLAHTGEADRTRPVSLNNDEWRCPWPPEADTERIDEQSVVIRVKVRVDGTATSARVVADPGHGFGQAAVACALATRFLPARDQAGRPIEAESPPVRVRFTR